MSCSPYIFVQTSEEIVLLSIMGKEKSHVRIKLKKSKQHVNKEFKCRKSV